MWTDKSNNTLQDYYGEKKKKPDATASQLVGVREYLQNAGLSPDGIGYSNGQVTYGGRAFTPQSNVNGVAYSTPKELNSFIEGVQNDSGNIGVRKTLEGLGLDPSKIGYANGQVTYNGVGYAPPINANGVTYGKKQDVYNFANKALGTEGDGLVQVNKYSGGNGMYDVDFNSATGQVTVGGKVLPHEYIDANGNAWAKESILKAAYDDLAKQNGIKNPNEIFENWKTNYGDKLDKAYDEQMNRNFTFSQNDLDNDPVYNAYKAMYEREAGRAYDDSLARLSARTGGLVSSMARSGAKQNYDYYMDKLNDVVPELARDAYNRYSTDRQQDLQTLGEKGNLYGNYYNYDVQARRDAMDTWNQDQDREAQRKADVWNDKFTDIDYKNALLGLEQNESNTDKTIAQNEYDIADMYNLPISRKIADRFGVMPDENGNLPTPNQYKIAKEQEYWNNYQKGIYDYQMYTELQNNLAQLETQYALQYGNWVKENNIKQSQKVSKSSGGSKKTSSSKSSSKKTTTQSSGGGNKFTPEGGL